jgi:hypothetical protein
MRGPGRGVYRCLVLLLHLTGIVVRSSLAFGSAGGYQALPYTSTSLRGIPYQPGYWLSTHVVSVKR